MGVEQAMNELVSELTQSVVERLAERYSFDASEALKWLDQEPSPKMNKAPEKGKKERIIPSIPLPFCGVVNEDWCRGVRLNHGLHTQCTQSAGCGAHQLCKTCGGQAAKNETEEPTYGRIEDRVQHVNSGAEYNSWRDPSGKIVTPYTKIMTKLGITRSDAEAEAVKFGWTISEQHFVVTKRSAGRPKKSTATSDTESENGEMVPKRRGRPRKERIVENGSAGDDLIAQLLANAQQAATESDEEVDLQDGDTDKHRLTALYLKYAPEKVPTIDAMLAKRPLGSVARVRMWGMLEKKYPEFFKPDKLIAKSLASADTSDFEAEDNDGIEACEFIWEGRTYLRAADNVLYDPDTQDEVGVWREKEQRIEELPTSDFE